MNNLRTRLSKCSSEIQQAWSELEPRIALQYEGIHRHFPQYTRHDASHARKLEQILDWLVPQTVWDELTDIEVLALLACLWAHDAGMGAGDEDIAKLCQDIEAPLPTSAEARTAFVRVHHAEFGRRLLEREFGALPYEEITPLGRIAGDIAKSHNFEELDKFQSKHLIGHSHVRPAYLGILLRLADILHCTSDRAPLRFFSVRGIDNDISIEHWRTHQAIVGVGPDDEGSGILLQVDCDDVDIYASVLRYRDAIQREVDYCREIAERLNLAGRGLFVRAARVQLQANTIGFLPEALNIHINVPAAISLLVGRHIYDDASVVVRELLQNAVDATAARNSADPKDNAISLTVDNAARRMVVEDHGAGMTLDDVKNSLLRACSSGFRKSGDSRTLARYGIGFLTTLVVSDRIDVQTRSWRTAASDGLRITIRDAGKPVRIAAQSGLPVGTRIELKLREAISRTDVRKWLPESPEVTAVVDGEQLTRQPLAIGVAREPLRFEYRELEKQASGMRVRLRASALHYPQIAVPCGLSFQSLDGFPPEVTTLPVLKKQLFVGGVPIINKTGDYPSFSSKVTPAFEKVQAAVDLYVDDPGRVELNLARNMLLDVPGNIELLDSAGLLACQLIADWYASFPGPREQVSAMFVSELWLTRFARGLPHGIHHDAHDERCLSVLDPLLGDVLGTVLSNSGEMHRMSVRDVANQFDVVVFASELWLSSMDPGLQGRLLEEVRAVFPGACLMLDCGPFGTMPTSPFDFMASYARSAAMLALPKEFKVTPLAVFDLRGGRFRKASAVGIEVFGTDQLFSARLDSSPASFRVVGGRQPWVVINYRSPRAADPRVSAYVQSANSQVLATIGPSREPVEAVMEKAGIPRDCIVAEEFHWSLKEPTLTITPRDGSFPVLVPVRRKPSKEPEKPENEPNKPKQP